MFDYVRMPQTMNCIQCGAAVSEFQTKDGKEADAEMVDGFCKTITPDEIMDGGAVYSNCKSCDKWNEYTVQGGKLSLSENPMF